MLELAQLGEKAAAAESLETLLGHEGNAARLYFERFARLLKSDGLGTFDFASRNRRPPKDAVNALLSFCYSMLAKDVAVAGRLVGLDPYVGFLHQPRPGRFSLALDVMEEFRPIVVDGMVLELTSRQQLTPADFTKTGKKDRPVELSNGGVTLLLKAYEERLQTVVRHPVSGDQVSYRRCLELQVRQVANIVLGKTALYVPVTIR